MSPFNAQDGQVSSRGNYSMGVPVGCFSFWDHDGALSSGRWSESTSSFEPVLCMGPTKKGLAELVEELDDLRSDTVEFDMSIGTFLSHGGFGIRNSSYLVGEPSLSHNGELALRRHLSWARLGGILGVRSSDDGDHSGWLAAALMAVPLPSPHQRLRLDLSFALGVQSTSADLVLRENASYQSESALVIFGPYAALQVDAAVRVHRNVEFVFAPRVEGGFPRDWTTTKIFRSPSMEPIRHSETWQVGRYSLGLGLGMRVNFY